MFISRPPDARPSWASDRGRDPRGVAARPSPGRRNVHGFVRSTRVGHLADHPHDCRDPVGRGRRLPESGHKCASGRASRFGRAAGSLGGKSVDGSGDATIARSRPRTFGGMEQAHPIGPRGGAIGDRNLPRRDLDGRRQHARRLPAEGRRADAHRLRPHHPKRRAGRDDGRAHAAIGESRGARPRLQHRAGGAARGAGPGGDRRVGPERDSQRRTGPGPHRGRQGPPRPGGMGPRLHRIWSPGVHDGQRHRFRPPGPPRHVRPGLRSIVAVLRLADGLRSEFDGVLSPRRADLPDRAELLVRRHDVHLPRGRSGQPDPAFQRPCVQRFGRPERERGLPPRAPPGLHAGQRLSRIRRRPRLGFDNPRGLRHRPRGPR